MSEKWKQDPRSLANFTKKARNDIHRRKIKGKREILNHISKDQGVKSQRPNPLIDPKSYRSKRRRIEDIKSHKLQPKI